MIKGVLKRVLNRFGLRLVRSVHVNTLDSHLLDAFSRLRINCVLDVGANDGDYGSELRRLGFAGHIVSFEPIAAHFERLNQRKAGDSKWSAHQLALGETDAEAEINVLQGDTFSSFLSPNSYGVDHFGSKMIVARKEVVQVRRLERVFDQVLAQVREPRVFLKTDTQGYDLAVIRGAGDKLRSILGVQVELSIKALYEGITTEFLSTTRTLQEMGFEVTGLFPVTRDPADGLTIVELDGVFCRVAARQDLEPVRGPGRTVGHPGASRRR